jgi:hypothetical protein
VRQIFTCIGRDRLSLNQVAVGSFSTPCDGHAL